MLLINLKGKKKIMQCVSYLCLKLEIGKDKLIKLFLTLFVSLSLDLYLSNKEHCKFLCKFHKQ